MTASDIVVASGLSETEHRKQLRRALIASTVGTTIEWYDFLLYGQVTGLVFGKLFFSGIRADGRRVAGVCRLIPLDPEACFRDPSLTVPIAAREGLNGAYAPMIGIG